METTILLINILLGAWIGQILGTALLYTVLSLRELYIDYECYKISKSIKNKGKVYE